MITLTNSFHRTKIRIRATVGQTVSHATFQRVRRALCGMSDCSCSGPDGTRESHYQLSRIGDHYHVVVMPGYREAE